MPSYRYLRIGLSKELYEIIEEISKTYGKRPTTVIRYAMILGLVRIATTGLPDAKDLYEEKKALITAAKVMGIKELPRMIDLYIKTGGFLR